MLYIKLKGKSNTLLLKTYTYISVSYTHLDVYKRQVFVVGVPSVKVAVNDLLSSAWGIWVYIPYILSLIHI